MSSDHFIRIEHHTDYQYIVIYFRHADDLEILAEVARLDIDERDRQRLLAKLVKARIEWWSDEHYRRQTERRNGV